MPGFVDVWINCPDRETAERIASACVAERLAACANILAPISSVYCWNGAIERADEVLLLKTRADLFDGRSARKGAAPLRGAEHRGHRTAAGRGDYARWLGEETREVDA